MSAAHPRGAACQEIGNNGSSQIPSTLTGRTRAKLRPADPASPAEVCNCVGGVLSPLLANIALSTIEERYERHVWLRRTPTVRIEPSDIVRRAKENRSGDERRGLPIFYLVRYADDFVLLVSAPPGVEQQANAERLARQEKAALAIHLRDQLRSELSETKTLVTPVTEPMRFLVHHIRCRRHPAHRNWVSASVIPKGRSQLDSNTHLSSLALEPLTLRGLGATRPNWGLNEASQASRSQMQ